MTPALLAPAALAALAAVLIPLVIHIARRDESRQVDFAALRWLDPKPSPRRRLRLDERLLLAVRLLLLVVVAVVLAKPVLWGAADDRPVVAVIPGVRAAGIGETAPADARQVWLAPGFPAVGGLTPRAPQNPVSLLRQLDAELPPGVPLTVVVPTTLDGVDAERPRLSRPVAWRVQPQAPPAKTPSRRLAPPLVVRHTAETADGVRYFRAAAAAWAQADADPDFEASLIDRPVDQATTYLVWLAAGPLPAPIMAWIRRGGTALLGPDTRPPAENPVAVVWRDPVGEPLAVAGRLGQGRVVHLTRPLRPASMPQLLEPDFPDVLARMLAPPPAPARVAAVDHAPFTGAAAYPQTPLDLRPWLAVLIALIFAVERALATRRTRGAAP